MNDICPQISIIVPIYKAEKYLSLCVKSILSQTFTDFELILVDDGSPDNSGTLCDKWASQDPHIRTIHKPNGGASSARNAGIDVARGEYLVFVDSDDWVDEKMLETLYTLLVENHADIAFCDSLFANKDGSCRTQKTNFTVKILSQTDLMNRFFRVNGEHDTHRVWGSLFSKTLFNGYRMIEGRMNEDVEACYQLYRRCKKAVYTNEPMYFYRQNADGVTNSKFTLKKMDLLYMWDLIEADVTVNLPAYAHPCEMNRKRAYFTLLCHMKVHGYDKNDPTLRQVKNDLKKKVRKYKPELLRWKMPWSRKAILLFL